MPELRLSLLSKSEDGYRFHVRTAVSEYEVSYDLSPGWRAQLQRLHWKAGNLLSEDDSFLAEVSSALRDVIFVEAERATWEPLIAGTISQFVIEIAPASRSAGLLPFELISIDDQYLVDVPNLKIVREITANPNGTQEFVEGDGELRVLHVSLGTDPIFELGRERALFLDRLPGVAVQFLMAPTLELLLAELNRFQPSVVHISSHGIFDVLSEEHGTALDDGSQLYTGTLLRHLHESTVRVVFLASCQSALFAAGEGELESVTGAMEIASFTFPVENDTARLMMAAFYRSLRDGSNTGDAISIARNANPSDVFSSFSLVHYRPLHREFARFAPSVPSLLPAEPREFVSSEEVLLRLDNAARTIERVVLLSPIGFGARTVLLEWKQLQEQSSVLEVSEFTGTRLTYRLKSLPGVREIEIVRFFEYDQVPGSAVVVVGEIGDFTNNRVLNDPAVAQARASMGPMVAEIPRIASAIAAGESANDALQAILLDNRLDSRLQALSQRARQLVRELIGLGGTSTLPLNPLYGVLSLSGQQLLDAQGELTEQRVAVKLGDRFILSPEIMFLADGLFPGWRQPNEKQLELIAGAFARVHQKSSLVDERDFQSAHALLQWSSNLGRWDILHELILICHPFYAAAGRSSQLISFMEIARDHLSGEERLVHEGNLSAR